MAWQDAANEHVNEPWVEVTLYFDFGLVGETTKRYSFNWIRVSSGEDFKGKLLDISPVRSSVGDIQRTWERNRFALIFDDSDYEFRTLETTLGQYLKGTRVVVEVCVLEGSTRRTLLVADSILYDWRRLDNLQFQIECEGERDELDNTYPDLIITRNDWPNADESAIGIPVAIIFGMISAYGDTDDGAFGYPSLADKTGLPMVDTTGGSEKHIIGISYKNELMDDDPDNVLRVYSDGVLKAQPADYSTANYTINGYKVAVIEWFGYSPTTANKISCDISAKTDPANLEGPTPSIIQFLHSYIGATGIVFDGNYYNAALAKESLRGYLMAGAMFEPKTAREWLDEWRGAWELDIFWDKDGECCFNYLSYISGVSANHYKDFLHVLDGFDSDPQVGDIVNKIFYGHTYHFSKTHFRNYETIEDTDSQTRYDGTFRESKMFYWIRDAIVAADIAYRKLLRHKDPPVFDAITFPMNTFSESIAGVIKLTHFLGRGSSGYNTDRFQIRATNYDLKNFTNTMLLENCENFISYVCILGDDTALPALWANADEDEREYCYLCDSATKEFSDGEPGKRLPD